MIRFCLLFVGCFVATALSLSARDASASIIYTTNDGTTWLGGGGPSIDGTQYFGVDFSITSTTQVAYIGGSIIDNPSSPGSIFGAILPLSLNSPYPASPSQIVSSALGEVTFTPNGEPNVYVPLSLTLQPGNYALVFGGGTPTNPGPFGATGSAVAVAVTNADTSVPQYISSQAGLNKWFSDSIGCYTPAPNCLRFSVFGPGPNPDFSPSSGSAPPWGTSSTSVSAVPLPAALPMFAALIAGMVGYAHFRRQQSGSLGLAA